MFPFNQSNQQYDQLTSFHPPCSVNERDRSYAQNNTCFIDPVDPYQSYPPQPPNPTFGIQTVDLSTDVFSPQWENPFRPSLTIPIPIPQNHEIQQNNYGYLGTSSYGSMLLSGSALTPSPPQFTPSLSPAPSIHCPSPISPAPSIYSGYSPSPQSQMLPAYSPPADQSQSSSVLQEQPHRVPVPQKLRAQQSTSTSGARVRFNVKGMRGVRAYDVLNNLVELDRSNKMVFSGLGNRSIHICFSWPGYKDHTAYITIKDDKRVKIPNTHITRQEFAKKVAARVKSFIDQNRKNSNTKSADSAGAWTIGEEGVRFEDVWLMQVILYGKNMWKVELEIQPRHSA